MINLEAIRVTEALVLRAQAGDAIAMEQLLREWRPKLIRFVYGQLKHEDAAQDVVQETLIKLANNIRHLASPAAFPGWAYTIARRECVEHFRRERRQLRDGTGFDDARLDCEADDNARVFEPSLEMEECLGRLRREDRELLSLHYWCGLELKEIAQIAGVAAGAVKTRLFRARVHLRELLCLPQDSVSAS
jgi:RNA polymerase sigma-70 factor (ECF subfamily)